MQAWIFDLDGTLTVPMHNFGALKVALGLPPELDVLGGIATRPEHEQSALHDRVKAWEAEHVDAAAAAPGSGELLEAIAAAGLRRGILTRNTRATALRTLDAIGLRRWFDDADVVGRECAPPKPSPAGVQRLLDGWGVPPDRAVLVGDYVDDLRAARAAGVAAVWIDHDRTGVYATDADRVIADLGALVTPLRAEGSRFRVGSGA